MTKRIKKISRLFHYWCGRLKLQKTIPLIKDNRMSNIFSLCEWDNDNIHLRYNARRLAVRPMYSIICDIFHEIGHLTNKLPYESDEEIITSEYKAEKFALEIYKKHYPKMYKEYLKWFSKRKRLKYYCRKQPLHFKALSKIKEYEDRS